MCRCGHEWALHWNGLCWKTYPGELCKCLSYKEVKDDPEATP